MKSTIYILFFILIIHHGYTQNYAPAAGYNGSTAIYKDSIIFVDWAKKATVYRSYKNIANHESGIVSFGNSYNATGKVEDTPKIVSLGDGGAIILEFSSPIINGKGADFAVFENAFFENETSENAFLELAFVEVSTNGVDYIRFPSISETQTIEQLGSFDNNNARNIYNLAGKYTQFYGTPFDLQDIKSTSQNTNININEINFIKIIDVIGSIDVAYASYDSVGNIINDPYPTEFNSGGFDLDAIGVINNQDYYDKSEITIFPNPFHETVYIKTNQKIINKISIYTIHGKLVMSCQRKNKINLGFLKNGIYLIQVAYLNKIYSQLLFKN